MPSRLLTTAAALLMAVSLLPSSARGLQGITIGIDTDPAGNGPGSLGTIEPCSSVPNEPGRPFQIDVFVDRLPEGQDLSGFNYFIEFDQSRFRIAAQDHAVLLNSAPGSSLTDLSEEVPDAESPHLAAPADFGTAEQGPIAGVLGRYSLEVLPTAQGGLAQFSLSPTSHYLFDSTGQAIAVDRASAGFIALGTACPAELPTPTPSPDEDGGAGQTPEPGTTPGADATPAADGAPSTPGPTETPGATATSTPGPQDGGETGGKENDDGASSWPYVVGGIAAGAAAVSAAAFLWWRRRAA